MMAERGYDAVILRNNPDLRWLTGAERTFDDEVAHTAFVTADGQWLHTDSRYYNTFVERLGEDTPWKMDMDIVSPAWWAAQRVLETKSRVVAVEDSMDLAFFDAFRNECNKASVDCLNPRMHDDIAERLRVVKDEEELALLRRAQEITDDAYDHICEYIKPGMTEQQIRVELETYMLTHGADAISFDSIIASGPNGANPHAQPGERKVQKGDMIVMDYGAGYHDYHADMTRTVVLGEPSEEQRKVYGVVRLANETCAAAIKPGIHGKEIQDLAVKVISDAGLRRLLQARPWPRRRPADPRASELQPRLRQAVPARLRRDRRARHLPARQVRHPRRGHLASSRRTATSRSDAPRMS
jgi:Xaa-Pro aminopeptidase